MSALRAVLRYLASERCTSHALRYGVGLLLLVLWADQVVKSWRAAP